MNTPRVSAGGPDVLSGPLLRALREETGLSQTRAARASGVSQSAVSRTESGDAVPNEAHVTAVLRLLVKFKQSTLTDDRIVSLIEQARQMESSNTDIRVFLQAGTANHIQREILRVEQGSSLVRSFHPSGVIGNLQARPLIESIFTPDEEMTREDAEKAIAGRLARAELLQDPNREWRMVQTEQALRWPVRDFGRHAAQLEHIARTVTEFPHLTFRVIPLDTLAPETAPVTGFHLYDDHTVILGTDSGPARIKYAGQIAMYSQWHADLMDLGLPEEESVSLVSGLAERYRQLHAAAAQ